MRVLPFCARIAPALDAVSPGKYNTNPFGIPASVRPAPFKVLELSTLWPAAEAGPNTTMMIPPGILTVHWPWLSVVQEPNSSGFAPGPRSRRKVIHAFAIGDPSGS